MLLQLFRMAKSEYGLIMKHIPSGLGVIHKKLLPNKIGAGLITK